MILEDIPIEILLLICDDLDVTDLNVLAKTCKSMLTLINPLLYQRALKSPDYKKDFLYGVIYGQANAVSKFWKAGVSMSEYEDYTDEFNRWPIGLDIYRNEYHEGIACIAPSTSAAKRKVLELKFHPLLAAALFGHAKIVAMLIEEGRINVDFRDKTNRTALWYAIEGDHLAVIKLLLEKEATITNIVPNKIQTSPFLCAVDAGNKSAIEMIFNELQNRSIPADVIKKLSETACYQACVHGFANIVDFLLRHGVDANLTVNERRLLYWASHYCRLPAVKVLVNHGAKMEKETDCGVVTAIYHGQWDAKRLNRESRLDILIYLLESGCNVANGGLHACALWLIVHAPHTVYARQVVHAPGRRGFNGKRAERNRIIDLLQKNGFDKKKCRNNCWDGDHSKLLESRMILEDLVEYVAEHCDDSDDCEISV